MKKLSFLFLAFMTMLLGVTVTSCVSSSNDDQETPVTPVDPASWGYHFDIFMTVGAHGGMNKGNGTIVRSVSSLDYLQGVISIDGTGTELADYSIECIQHGQYYYQIPTSNDRIVKYQIKNNKVTIIKEQRLTNFKVRNYTHAWIDDNTLVIMAASGDGTSVIWAKINTKDMSILGEGTLEFTKDEGFPYLTTSGLVTYRKSDNKLFYMTYGKDKTGRGANKTSYFRILGIDPGTMKVTSNEKSPEGMEMTSSAYGELLQDCVFYDETGTMYISVFDAAEKGHLARMKKGATTVDALSEYDGYKNADGKLLSVKYLGENIAIGYCQNESLGTAIDDYSCYYRLMDIRTGQSTAQTFGTQSVVYSGGRFSNRMAAFNGICYVGVSAKDQTNSQIYAYEVATNTWYRGAQIDGTHFFDRLLIVKD